MVTLFIACPAGLIPDGRQLARCIGQSAADEDTFAEVPRVAGAGALWSVAAGPVSEAWLAAATGYLTEPPWGCDMDAARRAQALLLPLNAGGALLPLDPSRICYVLGLEGVDAMAALGLTWVESEA